MIVGGQAHRTASHRCLLLVTFDEKIVIAPKVG